MSATYVFTQEQTISNDQADKLKELCFLSLDPEIFKVITIYNVYGQSRAATMWEPEESPEIDVENEYWSLILSDFTEIKLKIEREGPIFDILKEIQPTIDNYDLLEPLLWEHFEGIMSFDDYSPDFDW